MTTGFEERIFAFWTGDNPMTDNRKRCLDSFRTTGLEPVLVTAQNLADWTVSGHPLHPAYEYLSPVHRSDYLRAYFMHHHGGGYSDIKGQTGSWLPAVEQVLGSRRLVGAGYREIRGGTVWIDKQSINGNTYILSRAAPRLLAISARNAMRVLRWAMIGNGAFYFKPQSPLTAEWLNETERRLDLLLPSLRDNPAQHPRDKAEDGSGYPVPWAMLLGAILGPLSLLYCWRLSRSLPRPDFQSYQ